MKKIILVAGATGNLGLRIVKALLNKDTEIRVVVRSTSDIEKIKELENLGVKIYKVSSWNLEELKTSCIGVSCVVSALAGLREVVIDAQKVLLDAAIAAGVPRFIPSDYSLDFTKFSYGENRNLDLRREFHEYLDKTSITATSIFNGAFTELLINEMPMILFKQKMILYWGNKDYKLGFTTMDNTAEFTAKVALDSNTPRYLRIAGDLVSPREVKAIVSQVTGQKFRLFRPGGQRLLTIIIKIARKLAPGEKELYPAWQGMQYMHNMIDERSKIAKLDSSRYPEIHWTTVKDFLFKHHGKKNI
ncbi:nucleoside-diphosphate-sugar epimerase [Flavobacterium sp. CG_23.5]|uniref:NmrA family NAD(P)-binding protein n=1 Tax=unclassified Flavobacterium TaxID=196869 RepID=UPI0018C95121|nr:MULTISPECIES: NmrA family NAD(P)-binding protein [unclassified Flavobacterium]MBG6110436.1 nucleoside-diphosphate-sugar epimerase [Flavobacterium sp. CG_9.10]MBP2284137.1 nucleoside-diphosphate-sugar epimerase [Flavobacterium sp. CG_23.5]